MRLLHFKMWVGFYISLFLYSQNLMAEASMFSTECFSVDGTTRLQGQDPTSCIGQETCSTKFKTVRILTEIKVETGFTKYEEVKVGFDVDIKETIITKNSKGYLAEITITRLENGHLPMPVNVVNAFESLTLKFNCTKSFVFLENHRGVREASEKVSTNPEPSKMIIPGIGELDPDYFNNNLLNNDF
jgi:hypothetical protein